MQKGGLIMKKGVSLHIGINRVDVSYYGQEYALTGCHNDARDMAAICKNQGYSPTLLMDGEANAERIIHFLNSTANQLSPGDAFVLTYAGHGTQVPDMNADEPDKLDESWVVYDRLLIDDEIYQAFADFKPGVRILLISDSCHSGSISRRMEYTDVLNRTSGKSNYGITPPAFRTPERSDFGTYIAKKYADQYDSIYRSIPSNSRDQVVASVIQLAACQDQQLSADGPSNGLFTGKLKEVWNNGNFEGDHSGFCKMITRLLPATETPALVCFGADVSQFEKQKPFTINSTNNNLNSNQMKTETINKTGFTYGTAKPSYSNVNNNVTSGNPDTWSEIKKELEQLFPNFNFPNAQRDLAENFLSNYPGTANDASLLMSNLNFGAGMNDISRAATGAPIVRTFWWGFSVELSSQTINDLINVSDPINALLLLIAPFAGAAGPFIVITAAFIAGILHILRSLDRGNGVYISMSWFAAGVFIPTTV